MADDRWARADRIFDEALDRPAGERARFLDEACAGDEPLRRLVERLLAGADSVDPALDDGVGDSLVAAAVETTLGDDAPAAGTLVGRYRIEREIGRGGMAVVYLAERADGEFEQRVALKLVKRGTDTDDVVRRFAQERQILAAASHPDIARLLDGGVTDDGRPFLVLEYVDGKPIDRYCDERALSVDERLRLFVRVGRAVAHAHRNLVVHRDIKPHNVLVSADGDVKLLDFGIAKVLEPGVDDADLTRTRTTFLTPAYATPEQVSGGPITTASDVYQLGLLLYRLITGRAPYPLPTADAESLRRAVCESAPARPSANTGPPGAGETDDDGDDVPVDPFATRSTTPRELRRRLAGDLDNIVMKALRKEPERRYGTVAEFVADIENHLAGRPVSARPDTLGYRLSKFVARHTAASVAAVVVFGLLVAFAVTMSVQARRIARERDRANVEARTAREVSDFLTDLFRLSDPGRARGNSVTAREILDRGAERIARELGDQPAVRGRLETTIGVVYQLLGILDASEAILRGAVERLEATLGRDHPDTLSARSALAFTLAERGAHDESLAEYLDLLADRGRQFPPDDPETLEIQSHLGDLYVQMGRFEEAEAVLTASADGLVATLGEEHKDSLGALSNLAILLERSGKSGEAIDLSRRVLDIRRRVLGDDHPDTLASINNLGIYLAQRGRFDEAEPLLREAVEVSRRVRGPEHRGTASNLSNLGMLLTIQERYDQAGAAIAEALSIYRRTLGDDHPETMATAEAHAVLLGKTGHEPEAEAALLDVLARGRRVLGEDHPANATTLAELGDLYLRQGRNEDAAARLRESADLLASRLGPDHPETLESHRMLAGALVALGRRDEAERVLLAVLEGKRRTLADDPEMIRSALLQVAEFYDGGGDPERAAPYRAEAERMPPETPDPAPR